MPDDTAELEDQLVFAKLRAAVAQTRVNQAPEDMAAQDALRKANELVTRIQGVITRRTSAA